MTLTFKAILVALPVAAVVTTASTLVVLKTPWRAIPGTTGALVAAAQWHPAPDEPAVVPEEPALIAESPVPTPEATAVVDVPPPPAVGEPAEAAAPPVPAIPATMSEPRGEEESVDYARLRKDVQVVTSTLERFNQKLLRMIAQARAVQAGRRRPAAPDAGQTVALDAGSTAPASSDELSP